MAANKSVIVLTPNGRRQNVKVTPNTTILQVLEEVCKKYGYDTANYDVKHYNRILDANSIFRFTGLPNNAQLEMIACTKQRLESNVTIGIQMESGERVTGEFSPGTSLTNVLKKLCPDQLLPDVVLIYMHREISGLDSLEKTTLRSLGLNRGRAMIRLIHRDPEQPKTQAHVSAPLAARPTQESIDLALRMATPNRQAGGTLKTLDPITALKSETENKLGTPASILEENKPESICDLESRSKIPKKSESLKKEETETPMDITESNIPEMKVEFLGERNALVFNQAGAEALPRDELPDNFFELTVDDARHLLKDAARLRAQLDEAPLLTSAQRELDENKRVLHHLHKYKRTVIRIQFPDQLVLQGLFGPLETVQTIRDFVKDYLADPNANFILYTTPPRSVLYPDVRLIDANLVPSAIIYYSGDSVLTSALLNKLTNPRAAGIQAVKSRMEMKREDLGESEDEKMLDVVGARQEQSKGLGKASKASEPKSGPSSQDSTSLEKSHVPKWFKPLSKK